MWAVDAMYRRQGSDDVVHEDLVTVRSLSQYRFGGTRPTFAEINPQVRIATGTGRDGTQIMVIASKLH